MNPPGSAIVNVPATFTVTLNAPASQTCTVTPVCPGATINPPQPTIPAGQSFCQFTVSCPQTGTYSVDFSIAPALTRVGRPATLLVSEQTAGPTVTLTSSASQAVAYTFGQAFRAGDVPSGQHITAGEAGFDAVVLNRWPDGSVKFALISGIKTLAANVPAALALRATTTPPTGSLVSTSDLAATGATASISFGGVVASWSVADWANPFRQISSGRQMSSWHYRKPIGSDAHLVAWLEVRCYKNGAVEVLPWIENGYLSVANPRVKRGRAVFTLGGTVRYDSINDANTRGGYNLDPVIDGGGVLAIQHHSRHVLVRGGAFSHWLAAYPTVTIGHDLAYLRSTKLVPAYHPTTIAESSLASLTASYSPGRVVGMEVGMGGTGYAEQIGLLPNVSALYLVSGDPRAYRAAVSSGFSLGNYSIHYRDQATNRPLLFASHPEKSMPTDTGLPADDGIAAAVYASSHHPAAAYLPYLLTGWNWFVEEMQFQNSDHYLTREAGNRRNANFYFSGSAWGYSHNEQGGLRSQGWVWRTAAMTASCTPDADAAQRNQVIATLNFNAAKFRTEYSTGDVDNPYGANTLGVGGYGWEQSNIRDSDPENGWAAWQDAFFTAALGLTWDLEVVTDSTARQNLQWLRDFKYKAFVGLLGRPGVPSEYSFTRAANYQQVKVGQATGGAFVWRTNWGDVWTATWKSQNTNAAANTLEGGGIGSPLGLAEGYWGNIQPAIAYAVDHGAPGALAGYTRMVNATNWASKATDFSVLPVWGIRPRSVG